MSGFNTSFYGFALHLEDKPPHATVSLEIEGPKTVELATFECATEKKDRIASQSFYQRFDGKHLVGGAGRNSAS